MKVHIKLLYGNEHIVDVLPSETVLELKTRISDLVGVDAQQQTLLLLGKALSDEKQISFYPGINEGSKLVVVKKSSAPVQIKFGLKKFKDEMHKVLRRYYSESETNLIVNETVKELKTKVNLLSYDDLERLATAIIQDQEISS